MSDFDFLLKQINEKLEKADKKIQALAVRIIPIEEEKEHLEFAKKALEGEHRPAQKVSVKRTGSSLRSIVLETVEKNDCIFNTRELVKEIQKDHDYSENYITNTVSFFIKECFLSREGKSGKIKIRNVEPDTVVAGDITTDQNEKAFDSVPAL